MVESIKKRLFSRKNSSRVLAAMLSLCLMLAPVEEIAAAPEGEAADTGTETAAAEVPGTDAEAGETQGTDTEETGGADETGKGSADEERTDSTDVEKQIGADSVETKGKETAESGNEEPESKNDEPESTKYEEPENIVDGEIIVVYDDAGMSEKKSEKVQKEAEEALSDMDIEVGEEVAPAEEGQGTVVTAQIPEEMSVGEAVGHAMADERVSYAQPNFTYELMEDISDETAENPLKEMEVNDQHVKGGNTYYLDATKVTSAWKKRNYKDSTDVTVAVLDTGCRLDHVDLRENICGDLAYDAYYNRKLTTGNAPYGGDPHGHGTHVSGLVSARANNGIGIAGTSYNASILPVKIYDNYGKNATTSTILRGFAYCRQLVDSGKLKNLRVINISSGYYASGNGGVDLLCEEAINALADDYNILTVCSGGNGDGRSVPYLEPMYPSDFDACLSVTSLDKNGKDCAWSDYNYAKDISAPGEDILSTYMTGNNSYTWKDGTSMSAPIVSGICAFLWASKPDADVQDIVTAVESTADKIAGQDINRQATGSHGAINAEKAYDYLNSGTGVGKTEIRPEDVAGIGKSYVYNCERFKPEPEVKVNGATLEKGKDYTVAYRDNVNAGTAKMIINGIRNYRGTVVKTFTIQKKTDFGGCSCQISKKQHVYTGKEVKPEIIFRCNGERFVEGIDYTLSYENNVNVGTGKIKIRFKNFNITGVVSFTIAKANISDLPISLSGTSYVYNKKAHKPSVTVKNGSLTLAAGRDYAVSYSKNVNVGTATVKVTGQGANYTGTAAKTFRIVPKGTAISKLKKKSKGFTAKWKKQATQTSGYQVQYSVYKNFKKAKTKTIKKTKTTSASVSKLKKKKTYYVRVRTYKTVGGKKYYSSWSKVKKVKTK